MVVMDVVEVLSEEDDCIVDVTGVIIEERTEEIDMIVLVGERLEQVESCVTDTVAVLFE